MTLEQECFGGDQDYSWKQRWLSRSMRKLGEQAFPGAPYGEQYFQNLQRRNAGVYTLKSAFSTIHGFMGFSGSIESPTSLLSPMIIWKPEEQKPFCAP